MRRFLWGLPLLLATSTAAAGSVGVSLEGGGVYGAFGQGSDQEASCSSGATCSSRQKPRGLVFGFEGDYEVVPRLRVSVGLGTVAWKTSVARRFVTSGETQSTEVTVQATDQTDFHAYLVTAGAHFDLLTRPVVIRASLRLGGLLGGEATLTRGGTAECLSSSGTGAPLVPTGANDCATVVTKGAPTDRPMKSVEETASVGFTFVVIPEVRVAVPIGSLLEVGLGLGAIVGFADVTPKSLRSAPVNGPDDYTIDPRTGGKVYTQPQTPDGKPIGFVTSREHWLGQFVIPRGVLFVRASF